VIVGSGPRNGEGIPLTPELQVNFTNKYENLDGLRIDGFFTASPESQAERRAFLKRRDERVENRDTPMARFNRRSSRPRQKCFGSWFSRIQTTVSLPLHFLMFGRF
jgi:hypothetical protein